MVLVIANCTGSRNCMLLNRLRTTVIELRLTKLMPPVYISTCFSVSDERKCPVDVRTTNVATMQ